MQDAVSPEAAYGQLLLRLIDKCSQAALEWLQPVSEADNI